MRNQKGYVARLQRPARRHRTSGHRRRDAVPAPGRPQLGSTRCSISSGTSWAAAGIRPKLRTVLADSGYVSEENFARADDDGLRLLAR